MEKLLVKKGGFPIEIMGDIEKIESILIHYGAAKIILYGSLARGNYKADSDIDICKERGKLWIRKFGKYLPKYIKFFSTRN